MAFQAATLRCPVISMGAASRALSVSSAGKCKSNVYVSGLMAAFAHPKPTPSIGAAFQPGVRKTVEVSRPHPSSTCAFLQRSHNKLVLQAPMRRDFHEYRPSNRTDGRFGCIVSVVRPCLTRLLRHKRWFATASARARSGVSGIKVRRAFWGPAIFNLRGSFASGLTVSQALQPQLVLAAMDISHSGRMQCAALPEGAAHLTARHAAGMEDLSWRPNSFRTWLLTLCRLVWLSCVFTIPLLLVLLHLLLPRASGVTQERVERGLLSALENGGACSIKLGQWASTRPDVLPRSLCSTLSKLHDKAPQHSLKDTRRMLAEAFPDEERRQFIRDLSEEPIGSGCIGQVHEARAADGRRLAVKVLHPGVKQGVQIDLWLLCTFARAFERLVPLRGIQWLAISEQMDVFAAFMHAQLDMRTEAKNLERFNSNFSREEGSARVVFPRPLFREGLVCESVLVETFLDGARIGDVLEHTDCAADVSRNARIARIGLCAFLKMLLYDNFVHGDLHPGNILVDLSDGPEHPRVGFIDAGLTVQLTKRDQANFLKMFYAIAHGDGYHAGSLMLDHAPQQDCDDPQAFKKGMEKLVRDARFGDTGQFNLKSLHIGDVLFQVTALVREHHVKADPTFTALVMSIAVLEGLGRQLDPELDLFSVAMPMVLALPLFKHEKRYGTGAAQG